MGMEGVDNQPVKLFHNSERIAMITRSRIKPPIEYKVALRLSTGFLPLTLPV
jgi:hypothetical protein